MKISPNLLFALLFIGTSSCLEKVDATRVTDKDFQGVQNLENTSLAQLQNEILTNSPTLRIPKDGDSITQEIIVTKREFVEFTSPKREELNCRYTFEKYHLIKKINVNELDGAITYSLITTKIPKEPTFANIPYIESQKELCDQDLELLTIEGTINPYNLTVNHSSTITFLQKELFDSLSKCNSKLKVGSPEMSCLKALVLRGERNDSPFKTYSIEVEFSLLDDEKNLVRKIMKFEVSPEVSYLSQFSLLNLSGDFDFNVATGLNRIKSIKLLDESIQ